jgi:hypothetical protein
MLLVLYAREGRDPNSNLDLRKTHISARFPGVVQNRQCLVQARAKAEDAPCPHRRTGEMLCTYPSSLLPAETSLRSALQRLLEAPSSG